MHRAGCKRIFFGIESGDANVLKEMKKGITPDQARAAVQACVAAGIKAAGFFMVGYIGETTDSLIRSINFSSSLPLDYVSYTIAYPLPGTGFYDRVRERRMHGEWHKVRHNRLLFNTDFSEHKLRAAILKGAIQHRLNRMHMRPAARAFQLDHDSVLRALKQRSLCSPLQSAPAAGRPLRTHRRHIRAPASSSSLCKMALRAEPPTSAAIPSQSSSRTMAARPTSRTALLGTCTR